MGFGLEIYFVFDVEEPRKEYSELVSHYDFDHIDGLNMIMSGEDVYDAGDNEMRLLRQIEKVLEIDLGILDFWEEYEKFIEIEPLRLKLIELETALVKNTDFYKKICWGKDIEDRYLKKNFVMDVRFLIERLNLNIKNGASKVKYISC